MPNLLAWSDIRYAVRLLAKTPLFTLMTIVVLGGGMAVSIFTFAFLRTAMVAPLPLPEGERIVRVLGTAADGRSQNLTAADVARIRPGLRSLSGVGAYTEVGAALGQGTGARPVSIIATEPSLFATARTTAAFGRTLDASDAVAGAEPVLVLGERLWQSAFGGDPAIVGQLVAVNGIATRIIGVMPAGFGFPVFSEAWAPIDRALLDPASAGSVPLGVFARLAPGVSRESAESELSVVLARVRADHPVPVEAEPGPSGIVLRSFPMAQFGEDGPLLLAVLNLLAGLILLLACINVGNLLLARASERHREMALRQALGAPRARLVMQNLWESVILCTLGGAAAIGIAVAGLDLIDGWSQANLQGNLAFWWRWGYDPSVVWAAAGFVTVAVVLLGGLVSIRATSERFHETLRDSTAQAGDRAGGRLARWLVVTQVVAVTVVMFAGGLAAIVGKRVLDIDLGYDASRLMSAGIALPQERYPDDSRVWTAQLALADRLEQQAGVAGVLLRSPLAELGDGEAVFDVAGRAVEPAERPRAYVQAVLGSLTPVGVPVLEGRGLEAADATNSAPVAVVSRAVATAHWPGSSAIGRQIRLSGLEGPDAPWRTIVGVGGDVPMGNPLSRDRSALAVYLPLGQVPVRRLNIVVQHAGSETAARVAILETLVELDPLILPDQVASLEEMLTKSALMATATARMFGGCFLFALLLSISGTYGLMARSIARRTREIGVRRALGASDGTVLRMLLWQGSRQLGVGALVALPLTGLGGWAFSQVFPIGAGVAVGTAVVVSLVVALTVLLATWLPTRRAIQMDPSEVLRAE